jgi:beta-glucosidase
MNFAELIQKMTLEEKCLLLTGAANMETYSIPRLGIGCKEFADGPHGVRTDRERNCTHFPNLCNLAASWSRETAYKMGHGLGAECQKENISLLLGPGMNIKRTPLCGRNFEYLSEDPVLCGEMAASYITGLQSTGVGACAKHFAVNSQEKDRTNLTAEVDERTLREIYLKGFEIAVKKAKPESVMCAYNKVNAIWCSENKFLLQDILKDEWGYEGIVVSDWGAVHDICKALMAGLDLEMPKNEHIVEQIKEGLKKEKISEERINEAVLKVLHMVSKPWKKDMVYDRDAQHNLAREIAAEGIVLLEHNGTTLPLTKKYRRIGIIGEYGQNPLIAGQGSAEVLQKKEYTDSPIEEIKKLLPEAEILYYEGFKKREFSREMLWPTLSEFRKFIGKCDVVIVFAGSMESEDTENMDRRSINMNPNYEMFIEEACNHHANTVVVLQSGSALAIGSWKEKAAAILEMWLAGESAGGAIADVLCGVVTPSGKLPETFPKTVRKDLVYPGKNHQIEYNEKLQVGYRYYDRHTEEMEYPFGHGLSYTEFSYKDLDVRQEKENLFISFKIKNSGRYAGSEVAQVYVGNPTSVVPRPIKELKAFEKVYLERNEEKTIYIEIPYAELGYYNVMLHRYVTEPGKYMIYVGSSSQDIRLSQQVYYDEESTYSMNVSRDAMIG